MQADYAVDGRSHSKLYAVSYVVKACCGLYGSLAGVEGGVGVGYVVARYIDLNFACFKS